MSDRGTNRVLHCKKEKVQRLLTTQALMIDNPKAFDGFTFHPVCGAWFPGDLMDFRFIGWVGRDPWGFNDFRFGRWVALVPWGFNRCPFYAVGGRSLGI